MFALMHVGSMLGRRDVRWSIRKCRGLALCIPLPRVRSNLACSISLEAIRFLSAVPCGDGGCGGLSALGLLLSTSVGSRCSSPISRSATRCTFSGGLRSAKQRVRQCNALVSGRVASTAAIGDPGLKPKPSIGRPSGELPPNCNAPFQPRMAAFVLSCISYDCFEYSACPSAGNAVLCCRP